MLCFLKEWKQSTPSLLDSTKSYIYWTLRTPDCLIMRYKTKIKWVWMVNNRGVTILQIHDSIWPLILMSSWFNLNFHFQHWSDATDWFRLLCTDTCHLHFIWGAPECTMKSLCMCQSSRGEKHGYFYGYKWHQNMVETFSWDFY